MLIFLLSMVLMMQWNIAHSWQMLYHQPLIWPSRPVLQSKLPPPDCITINFRVFSSATKETLYSLSVSILSSFQSLATTNLHYVSMNLLILYILFFVVLGSNQSSCVYHMNTLPLGNNPSPSGHLLQKYFQTARGLSV